MHRALWVLLLSLRLRFPLFPGSCARGQGRPMISSAMPLAGPLLTSSSCLRSAHTVPAASPPVGPLCIFQRPDRMAHSYKNLRLSSGRYNHSFLWAPSLHQGPPLTGFLTTQCLSFLIYKLGMKITRLSS